MLHYEGLVLGLSTFLVIGLFHPIVVLTEYHFGTRPWWAFLFLGLACSVAALFIPSIFWSALCGIVGFSSFWTIKELFEQEERVKKGWFPRNPKRRYPFDAHEKETREETHVKGPEDTDNTGANTPSCR